MLESGVVVVPGVGFGRGNHLRLSFAVAPETVDLALEAFDRLGVQEPERGA